MKIYLVIECFKDVIQPWNRCFTSLEAAQAALSEHLNEDFHWIEDAENESWMAYGDNEEYQIQASILQ